MKKTFLLIVASLLFETAFACSCSDYHSFTNQVNRFYSGLTEIAEFEITKKESNNITVKILNAWKGNLSIGQEVKIWTLPGGSDAGCYPSTNVSYFKDSNRGLAQLKTTAEGLYYIPFDACGTFVLKVENDTVRGASFGWRMTFSDIINTIEDNVPYETFLARFNAQIAIITDLETKPLSTSSIELSPNPASAQLKLQGYLGEIKIVGLATSWETSTQLDGSVDISHLASGWYVLECLLPDRTIRKKFVKE